MKPFLFLCFAFSLFAQNKPAVEVMSEKDLQVTVDTTAAPDAKEWATEAVKIVEHWTPILAVYLDGAHANPPKKIELIFKPMDGVAHASSNQITISSKWIKQQPQDFGLVVHELVHVIQAYPPGSEFWLVEGMADAIRFGMSDPAGLPKQLPPNANYRNGYRIAGAFLLWIEKKYKTPIVPILHRKLRDKEYRPQQFKELTGKTVDELWEEFKATVPSQ